MLDGKDLLWKWINQRIVLLYFKKENPCTLQALAISLGTTKCRLTNADCCNLKSQKLPLDGMFSPVFNLHLVSSILPSLSMLLEGMASWGCSVHLFTHPLVCTVFLNPTNGLWHLCDWRLFGSLWAVTQLFLFWEHFDSISFIEVILLKSGYAVWSQALLKSFFCSAVWT